MAGNYSMPAMILGIVAGLVLIVGGILGILAMSTVSALLGAELAGAVMGWLWIVIIVDVICGVLAILGGILAKNPAKRVLGGILMIVAGAVSILGGGGIYFIGTVLGIVGGILALISKA